MKKILLTVVLLGAVGAAIGYYLYNKPHENMRSGKPDIAITATELFTAYSTDETAGDQAYLGKKIQVTGTVKEVKQDEEGKTGVTLESGDMMFGVVCKLSGANAATAFKAGDQATFIGRCSGMLMDVVIDQCVAL